MLYKLSITFLIIAIISVPASITIYIIDLAYKKEHRTKIAADAKKILFALLIYKKENNNSLPSSFNDLKFEDDKIDFESFMLFHPPSKAGQLNKDFFAQANMATNTKELLYASM